MNKEEHSSLVIINIASIVIIIAGLMAAKSIMIPILLAVFITILTSPLVLFLQARGLNNTLSLIGVILIMIFVLSLLGLLISSSLNSFALNLPVYEEKFRITLSGFVSFMQEKGFDFSQSSIATYINPSKMAQFASSMVKSFGSVFTNGLMVLLLVVFMLLEASVLHKKLEAIHVNASSHVAQFLANVKQYMMIKSIFSFLTGFIVYISLLFIGLDYALLWGVLAFALNFIPNIGSVIAAVPAVLLALIQLGYIGAIEVAVLFTLINVVIGSILEPKYMGQGLGLSTLVIFISLIFWGWVFGPVGMLLSIPLTIMLKLSLELNTKTKWIAMLLDSQVR